MAAAELAALFPARVPAAGARLAARLVARRCAVGRPPHPARRRPAGRAVARSRRAEAARRWAAQPDRRGRGGRAPDSIARRAAIAKFIWPIPDKGVRKRLHRITAPTLLLWGDADRANPVVYAEEWQRRIKGAAVKLLPGGHMVHHESPDADRARGGGVPDMTPGSLAV